MKIIFRIVLILAAAAILGGAMYAAVNTVGASASFGERGERMRPTDGDGDREDMFRSEHEGRERDFDDGRGFFLPFGMVKALIFISVTAAIYYFAEQFTRRKKRLAV